MQTGMYRCRYGKDRAQRHREGELEIEIDIETEISKEIEIETGIEYRGIEI